MGKLRQLFADGARLTSHDVEARLFVAERNAREYLKILHGERAVFICEYRRDTPHGLATPVFKARESEEDVDVPRPRRMTPAELRRRCRANPEVWEAELKSARIRRKRAKFLAEPLKLDPLMAAVNRDAMLPKP